MLRILVTGSRDFGNYNVVSRALVVAIETLIKNNPDDKEIVVVHGGARGADTLADDFVLRSALFMTGKGYRLRSEKHRADWNKYNKAAGPIRNQEMVDLGADICLKFIKHGAANTGTTDCARRAAKAGIEIMEFTA